MSIVPGRTFFLKTWKKSKKVGPQALMQSQFRKIAYYVMNGAKSAGGTPSIFI
jgi:hypothetical protein